ncbi:glycosyltransferase family 4 protein [Pseudoxanthomonas dokdonensis]|uniref:Glycosyltransferase subfamily 4-like N-terminal domain-containing protein n=1 Tax=Pseudoxanthomonas dokdonensis TaxID=344882 RepID=A0A0R0CHL6_9GAMM|nr:glycosyltransferase family 4 protein [Pseudoxanthomonas dokdonensis]KRG69341.1 hypothetical protein ABB29_09565 [Pseudoxanthomonas dokdonensis]
MKLLFTNFHRGSGGGHTTYVRTLASALSAEHEIHVAAPAGSSLLEQAAALPGVHVLAQPFPNGLRELRQQRQALLQLRSYLITHGFDLVHVNGSADHRLLMAAVRGMHHRPRIVLTKHNSKPWTGFGHWLRARLATDQLIAVCDYTRRELLASPYRQLPITTIHNGVDVDHFRPWAAQDAAQARRQWLPSDNCLVLGSNAGTADYKGWTDLAAGLALLDTSERARFRVLIAGKPPDASQLRQLADLGVQDLFCFPGLLADTRPLVAALDVGFVLSHAVETISFACREMMAMGKPVLVTDYAGLPENIEPGRDGWVVPARDPAAIAETLRWLLANRARLQAMGDAARLHAERDFGVPQFVRQTEQLYQRISAAAIT